MLSEDEAGNVVLHLINVTINNEEYIPKETKVIHNI